MKNIRIRDVLAIVANIVLVAIEILGIRMSLLEDGVIELQYYTEIANIFSLIAAIVYVVSLIIAIFKEKEIPKLVSLLKYMSVISLVLTLIIVLVVLAPFYNNAFSALLFSGSYLFYHTLAPIVALISFMFIEDHNIKGVKDSLIGTSITILYAIVMIILNVTRTIVGPYPFLLVYKNTFGMSVAWFIGIVGGTFLIAELIGFVSSKGKRVIK
jgi:hypothetical protein